MKNTLLALVLTFLSVQIFAQVSFMNSNHLFEDSDIHSGVATAVFDMNGDQLDDVVRLDQGHDIVIDYQQLDGTFVRAWMGSVADDSEWAMSVADIDNNGYGDIMTGGYYNGIKIFLANEDGTAMDGMVLPGAEMFSQATNLVDINNDGYLDAFVCHDDAESRIWQNMGDGTFEMADDWIDMRTTPESDNSGNYGSVWCDYDLDGDIDLHIAKCRQSVGDSSDPRRINVLFQNDGSNNYSEKAEDHGLKIGNQSWTVDFGDFDNDGDFDCFLTNHNTNAQLLENVDGMFIDISDNTGIPNLDFPIQAKMVDLDNDGFLDILVSGGSDYYFHNNGDKTFTEVEAFYMNEDMLTFAVGDLNHDGFPDVSAGYGGIYTNPSNEDDVLWMNEGNDNNWLVFNLEGTDSNRSAVGAKVKISGSWGQQIREVRAGESYGVSMTSAVMFGLGTVDMVEDVEIEWPSGNVDLISDVEVNQHIYVQEQGCIAGGVDVTADGPTTFCSGGSVVLTAPSGYDGYEWSDGQMGQSITVTETGAYKVTILNGDCQANSQIIHVIVDPDETPTILEGSEITLCPGEVFTLTSSEHNNYTWSNNMNTQSIAVDEPGEYTVSVDGLCDNFTSEPFILYNHDIGMVTIGDTVMTGEQAILHSNGTDPQWYDQPDGGILLASGNEYTTDAITTTTTFYVEADFELNGSVETVGEEDISGTGSFIDQPFTGLELSIAEPVILTEVTLFTESAGMRSVAFFDFNTNEMLGGFDVDLVEGENVVTPDFEIPASDGVAMYLSTMGDLFSLEEGFQFPYVSETELVTIEGSLNSNRYDYFFNLKFKNAENVLCRSPREPVTAYLDIELSATNVQDAFELNVFPNPSNGQLFIQTDRVNLNQMQVIVYNGVGAELTKSMRITDNALDLSLFAKGVYFIQFSNELGSVTRRVIIQ